MVKVHIHQGIGSWPSKFALLVVMVLHFSSDRTDAFQVRNSCGVGISSRMGVQRFSLDDDDPHRERTSAAKQTMRVAPQETPNDLIALPVFQKWMIQSVKKSYDKALSIPCPFFRRRAADAMDAVDMILRFLLIRHKSVVSVLEPPGWRCKGDTTPKTYGITISALAEVIRNDWKIQNDKGYYITGRLSTNIYRDDCFFDGPDPDMPVRGLRKYLNAASQLFDANHSTAELLQLSTHKDIIVVHWRLNGVLRLPWRPKLPELTGSTTYCTDQDGLIYKHIEQWDQSVLEAFLGTFWPPIRTKFESIMSG